MPIALKFCGAGSDTTYEPRSKDFSATFSRIQGGLMGKFIAFIINNFFHVAPILAVGGFGAVIILERTRALLFAYPLDRTDAFFEKIRVMVMSDRLADALALCERFRGKPVATIVRAGLLRADQ